MTNYPVLARVTNSLPVHAVTLYPHTKEDRIFARAHLTMWLDEDDGRFIVSSVIDGGGHVGITTVKPALGEEWDTIETPEGILLDIRAKDCGASCYCAGEFRVHG